MQMINSMTGFGRCELVGGTRKFTVEVKSVNHRYLDVNIKMPKRLNFFDASIRNLLKEYIQRGKVDLYITYEDLSEQTVSVKYHPEVAASYLAYLKEMAESFSLENDIRVSTLSRYPEVFSMEEQENKISIQAEYSMDVNYERFADCRIHVDICPREEGGELF